MFVKQEPLGGPGSEQTNLVKNLYLFERIKPECYYINIIFLFVVFFASVSSIGDHLSILHSAFVFYHRLFDTLKITCDMNDAI